MLGKCVTITTVLRTLWDGPTALYVPPATPIQMQIVSTDAADTAAGTGIHKVQIDYLDTNYIQKSEILTLNGVTAVNTTATNILRVNDMYAIEVGTGRVGAGTISLQAVGGAVTYSLLSIGRNRARTGIYTVPAGYQFNIDLWERSSASTSSIYALMSLLATANNGILYPSALIPIDEQILVNSNGVVNYLNPLIFPAKTDISLAVVGSSATAISGNGALYGNLQAV